MNREGRHRADFHGYIFPNGKVLVLIPGARGRYLVTDRCALHVRCRQCERDAGEPCSGHTGDNCATTTHWVRKKDYRDARALGIGIAGLGIK